MQSVRSGTWLGSTVGAVVLAVGVSWPLVLLGQISQEDLRQLRRTSVVEVFEAGRESVVFVTGPVYQDDRPKLEEFFKLPGTNSLEQSVGSGMIIHPTGYAIANAHGVEKLISHAVALSDGKKYRAELIASDADHDVALLKVDADRPLPAARLGAAGDVMIGESVIVIGHPHGLLHTCTTGIVSAVGRTTNLADRGNLQLTDLIQTDAAINPGSSGGPWFNVVGEVMGMTVSKKGGADNIGFAVPAATIRRLLPDMLDVERRYGLVTGMVVRDDGPCRVTAVQPGSPAAGAGVQAGDVMTGLTDTSISSALDYHFALVGLRPGQTLDLDLVRQDQPVYATLTLGQRPNPDGAALLAEKLGLEAVELTEAKIKKMLLHVARGVEITAVRPGFYRSVDHKPEPGDVLARINKIRPRDLDHLGQLLDRMAPGDAVNMVFVRYVNNTATRIDIKLTIAK